MAVDGVPAVPESAPTRIGPSQPEQTSHEQAIASIAARRALPPTPEVVNAPEPDTPAPEAPQAETQETTELSEATTPEQTTPETEVQPEESQTVQAEDEALTESEAETPVEAESEAEPITSIEELPDTVKGIAEALEVDTEALLDHIKVPLPGTDQTITLREAQRGYLREDTFTRKTQELADDRQKFNGMTQEYQNAANGRLKNLDAAVMAVHKLMGEQPDANQMAALAQEDPEAYAKLDAGQKAVNLALQQAHQARDQVEHQASAETEQRKAQYRDEQIKLLVEKEPELKDPKELEKFTTGLVAYLRSPEQNYTDKEISDFVSGPYDHRNIITLKRAMRDLAAHNAKPVVEKQLKNKRRVLKPKGSNSGRNNGQTTLTTLQASLRQAPTRRDQQTAARALIRAKLASNR